MIAIPSAIQVRRCVNLKASKSFIFHNSSELTFVNALRFRAAGRYMFFNWNIVLLIQARDPEADLSALRLFSRID
jgi:hypothetical protein